MIWITNFKTIINTQKKDIGEIKWKIEEMDSFLSKKNNKRWFERFIPYNISSDEIRKWKFVENFGDFIVKYVERFPDYRIKFENSFLCLPRFII